MITQLARLGAVIEDAWHAVGFRRERLPGIATEILGNALASLQSAGQDVISSLLELRRLPPQANIHSTFGQPPLTLYRTDRMYVDVLFWIDGTTAIHQHAFSGAFGVLEGASIHSRYSFATSLSAGDLRVGALTLTGAEMLQKGDARPIISGSDMIHSLFHLHRPTLSVVARTHWDAETAPQFSYKRPGVGVDPFRRRSDTQVRKAQLLALMRNSDRSLYQRAVEAVLAGLSPGLAFQALLHEWRALDGADDASSARGALLAASQMFHTHWPALPIVRVLEGVDREGRLVALRRRITDPEGRLWLALMLNLPGNEAFSSVAREAFGAEGLSERFDAFLRRIEGLGGLGADRSDLTTDAPSRVLPETTMTASAPEQPPSSDGRSCVGGTTRLDAYGSQ